MVTQIIWGSLYSLFIAILIMRREQLVRNLLEERVILLMLGLSAVSTLWSDFPLYTVWQTVRLFATTIFGIYLATTYTLDEIFQLVAWACGLCVVASSAFVFLVPDYGTYSYLGHSVWNGVFDNKNALGRGMALAACIWAIWAIQRDTARWFSGLILLLSFIALLLSDSKTWLLLTIVLLILLLACSNGHRSVVIFASLFVAALSALFLILEHPITHVLDLLNRDPDMTGRAEIWEMVIGKIREHPWLGHGYMAFWMGPEGASADIRLAGWIPPHAHNGYLDLALYFGLAGPVLFLLALVGPLIQSVHLVRLETTPRTLFPVLLLMLLLLGNLTESGDITPNTISWELFVMLRLKRSMQHSELSSSWRHQASIHPLDAAAPVGTHSN